MSTRADTLQMRRHGLRIAMAVTFGFVWAGLSGQVIPFLGPLFAISLLATPGRLQLSPGIGLIVVVLAGSIAVLLLTELLGGRPTTLLLLLGLLYFTCFVAQAQGRGGGMPFLIIVTGIIVPMFGITQTQLGQSIVLVMLDGVVTALMLTIAAHLVFPEPVGSSAAPPAMQLQSREALQRATANTAILLCMMYYCLTNDALAAAAVVPITVASLLGQLDLVQRPMAAVGLILVNLLGGIVASFAFAIYAIRPSALTVLAVVLIVSLIFAGKAVANRRKAPMYLGALTTFCILFGLGVSPIPGSAAESFSTRIGFVLFAMIYAVTFAALLWRPQGTTTEPVA